MRKSVIWGVLGVMLAGALGLGSGVGMAWAAEEEETTGVNVQEAPSRTGTAEDEEQRGRRGGTRGRKRGVRRGAVEGPGRRLTGTCVMIRRLVRS